MKIIHLTAHLGGGVGRALSGLSSASAFQGEHVVICLEMPEKDHFVNYLRTAGIQVIIQPDDSQLRQCVMDADIVQLEWWRHPATVSSLQKLTDIPMRLLVWCHVSGLHNEMIPEGLIDAAMRFILTSACSYQARSIKSLSKEEKSKLAVIHSNNGLESWPSSKAVQQTELAVGYLGSFNFSKLHPHYVDYLASVELRPFDVLMIGEATNADTLVTQAKALNRPDLFRFSDFSNDVAGLLDGINVLAYLQNPTHYGTNENALLEAMAMGIVPVVLNNPAEQEIVEHGNTGLVVTDPKRFAEAINWLHAYPKKRREMGLKAAETVRQRHITGNMQRAFDEHYQWLMQQKKQPVCFQQIFGETPAQWFLSCQQDPEMFKNDGAVDVPLEDFSRYSMLEETKGSARHFHRYFPHDKLLAQWARGVALSC